MCLNKFTLKTLSISLLIFILSCNHTKKHFSKIDNHCLIENQDSSFEKQLYPFDEFEYSTLKMAKYFSKNVKIDSGYSININKDTVFFYRFFDDRSELVFSLEGYKNSSYNYNIAKFHLNSELIQLKNGIRYGMKKRDFFTTINYYEVDCDTIEISDAYYGIYFNFVFQDNRLESISKEYIH